MYRAMGNPLDIGRIAFIVLSICTASLLAGCFGSKTYPNTLDKNLHDQRFDLPSTIYDLPFLSETAKRSILGGNAARVFGLQLGAKLAKVA